MVKNYQSSYKIGNEYEIVFIRDGIIYVKDDKKASYHLGLVIALFMNFSKRIK